MGKKSVTPFADIALPVPVDKEFTYQIPPSLESDIAPGARVIVPFGGRRMTGYVMRLRDRSPDRVRLKAISRLVDDIPLLHGSLLELAAWMADYYVHPVGEILRAMLPPAVKGKGRLPREEEGTGQFPEEAERPPLNPAQREVFEAVRDSIRAARADRYFLFGVTGSGKTEVYLRAIDEALGGGKSALVLIPEIALIPQTTSRFRRRFGRDIAVLHSRLTGAQRASIWKGASRGEIRVVIGPRSAVFVPLRDLGIIVVDEEQDSSYKQEEKPHYNAVAVAAVRAQMEKAVLLLGSATPSLETYQSARRGELRQFRLDSRPHREPMPSVDIVDMREREGIFSDELLDALEGCIHRREQAIVLINRRGHANFIQCRRCGWIDRCPRCSISLTYHSRGNRLLCHYCGWRSRLPDLCPRCGAYQVLHRGVGTQRVEMELGNLLPRARVLRMDLDTTGGKRGHLEILERFGKGEADILLGTQMVAKGHHYPNVTVVGVLNADGGINFPDFRAAERTFHLLFQAAGRTGRGEKPGRVLVQAYSPTHYIFPYLVEHDFTGFADTELAVRRELDYPPASKLILFTLSSTSAERAMSGGTEVKKALDATGLVPAEKVLGPTPALIEKLRGRFRVQVLVKGELSPAEKKKLIGSASRAVAAYSPLDLRWNVDPLNMF